MAPRISLALTFHNHQPIGNFGWVFESTYEHAYEPMIGALERHPTVRVGLHYSGPLLEWLAAERPGFLARVRSLVARDQAEILGGGLYEPILAAIPDRDRQAQLTRLADEVERRFGVRPAGAWLAERVWEPDVPSVLARAGYRWTILDDAHLRSAGIDDEAMWGPYVADDQGDAITVFGTEQGLRYRIPFQDVDAVIAYLSEHATEAGDRLGTMGDDGEKFGAWPDTFEHCWGRGRWVERFFEALEANASWLRTVRPSDWLAGHAPLGRAAIPTGSYAEMNEWSGGFWRNFQVRYREVNDLQKQMLRVSAAVAELGPGPARDQATDHLHRGQSNDTYWHGLFGGIYIPHMRAATLGELIAAEDETDAALGRRSAVEVTDLDLDGREDVRLADDGQVVTIDLDEGAGIGSWDIRAAHFPLAAVLRRRRERDHAKLRPGRDAAHAAGAALGRGPRVASIHEAVRVKEAGLDRRLVYDAYERRAGLVRLLPTDASPAAWRAGGGPDLGDLVNGAFEVDGVDAGSVSVRRDGQVDRRRLTARKTLRLDGSRTEPSLELSVSLELRRDSGPLPLRVGIEWPTLLLGGGGNPAAWWELDGNRSPHDGSGEASDVERIGQGNDWLGLAIATSIAPAGDAWWAPIETVSNSEAGFERVYQGSALLISWLVTLEPGIPWSAAIEHRVRVTAAPGNDVSP